MDIRHLKNGNLAMYANNLEKDWIKSILKDIKNRKLNMLQAESKFISEFLREYTQVSPEDIGALTSAPLIMKGEDAWGYMDYAIFYFLEELLNGYDVIWTK